MQIPLFPLHVVLFPGAHLPLHVFEPRYRTMMSELLGPDDAPNPDAGFGVACIRGGFEVGARAETYAVGCFGAVEWVRRQPDGTIDMLVRGTRRLRILDRPDDAPYPRAEATFIEEPVGPRSDEALKIVRSALQRYAAVVARFAGEPPQELELPDDPVTASYAASRMLAVDVAVHQSLLEAPSASSRLIAVASHARSEARLLDAIGVPLRRPRMDDTSFN